MRRRDPTVAQSCAPADMRQRFETLYTENYASILGYLLRRTSSADDAADVLAETFLIAWRRLDDVPADGQARPWLYGVARRTLANHRRGERRRTNATEGLRSELTRLTQARRDDLDEMATLRSAFQSLSAEEQELLGLVGWEGLDYGAAARVLGCSRNAVRIRLYRARRAFARELRSAGITVDREETQVTALPAAAAPRPFLEGDRP